MGRDDDIDDQVRRDWEFTRRAEQLLDKLRTQGNMAGDTKAQPDTTEQPSKEDDPPKHK
jgi:hypothetical protein